MKRNRCIQKGFSLVELIVVLVIIAILAAASIVGLTAYIRKSKCETAIIEARAVVTAAQSSLIERYDDGDLNVDGTKTFQLAKEDGSGYTKVTCGAVTNWMMTAAYYDLKLADRYQADYEIAKGILKYVNASEKVLAFNSSKKQNNPVGYGCQEYCNTKKDPVGIILVYDEKGKVIFMQYYRSNTQILVTYENGSFTADDSKDCKFVSYSRLPY